MVLSELQQNAASPRIDHSDPVSLAIVEETVTKTLAIFLATLLVGAEHSSVTYLGYQVRDEVR